jgi:hypothetical protein
MWIKQQRASPSYRQRTEMDSATSMRLAAIAGDRSCGEIVQRITKRPIGRLARLAVGKDVPGVRVLDRGGVNGERDHAAALQQPQQAGVVVTAQPGIAQVRLCRRLVQPE